MIDFLVCQFAGQPLFAVAAKAPLEPYLLGKKLAKVW
jgi:hypothetical protein